MVAVESMGAAARWRYALKPASWPKVFVPAVFGQVVGALVAGRLSGPALLWGVLWTAADIAFIVWLNDWGDREVDALKRRMFPRGCSPKTIPDGLLSARAVLGAGLGAGALALGLAAVGGAGLGRPALLPLAALSLGIFVAYTLPPLRLNYRGGGELLEMVGVGGVLPALHVYAQCGEGTPAFFLRWLPGLLALSLASALASGLSDEESDRAGGKRTFTTAWGNTRARRVTEGLVGLGALLWGGAGGVLAVPVVLFFGGRMLRRSAGAVTNAFAEQGAYKQELHRAIWWGTAALAASLVLTGGRTPW